MTDEYTQEEIKEVLLTENVEVTEKREVTRKRGRPKKVVEIKDGDKEIVVEKSEYTVAMAEIKKTAIDRIRESIIRDVQAPLTEEEFEVLNKTAAPRLFYRAYNLAMLSGNLSDVTKVARLLAEYGYGKPTQQVIVSEKAELVRRGWLDAPDLVPIEAEEVCET